MKALLPLLFLFSLSASAQVRHLVFDLDGLMFQGVPQRNVDKFTDKDAIITLQEGSANRYYYVAPQAADVIRSLHSQPQVLVHFFSRRDPKWVHAALNKIYVNKRKGVTLANLVEREAASKFLSSENLRNGKIDLRMITSDLDNVAYITTTSEQLVDGQQAQEFNPGQNFYVFETYAQAEAEHAANGSHPTHAQFIPTSESEWKLERFKFPLLNVAMRKVLKLGKGTLAQDLKSVWRQRSEEWINLGIKQTADGWREIGPRWQVNGSRIQGCAEYNNIEDRYLRSLPLETCITELSVSFRFVLDKNDSKVTACGVYSNEHDLLVQTRKVSECLEHETVLALWTDLDKRNCAYYTTGHAYVSGAATANCSNQYYLKNPYTQKYEQVEVRDNDNVTLEEIFNQNKPKRNDVRKLWFAWDKDYTMGFSLNDCRDSRYGYHTILESNGELIERCKPDTLYSWGPQGKLDNLKYWMGNGSWVSSYRPLFMVRSPVGSFGYGNVPVRVKLRKDVRWIRTDLSHTHCDKYTETTKQNAVFYRTMSLGSYGHLLDYTVCSPGPIESWSYGTKEHYDEVVKEYNWILDPAKTYNDYELYISGSTTPLSVFRRGIDGYDFSDSTFVRFMNSFLDKIESRDEAIYWNPSVPKSQRTRDRHFSTNTPIYFNHR